MATKNKPETKLLNETFLLESLVNDPKSKEKLQKILEKENPHFERSWELLSMCNDFGKSLKGFENCEAQLKTLENNYFKTLKTTLHPPQNLPSVVNVDTLLQVEKKVGLVCPDCGEQETVYKLFANRSADEGMTAYCKCKVCKHTWRLKM